MTTIFKNQNDDKIKTILAEIFRFEDADMNVVVDILLPASHLLPTVKHQTICQQGEPSAGLIVVVEGQVKISLVNDEGRERILELSRAKSTFYESTIFVRQNYPANLTSLTNGEILIIQRPAILKLVQTHQQAAAFFLARLARQVNRFVEDIEACCIRSARQRVVGYLLAYVQNGTNTVTFDFQKYLIASKLNLSAETFSRILHSLSQENIIAVDDNKITILDFEKLAETC